MVLMVVDTLFRQPRWRNTRSASPEHPDLSGCGPPPLRFIRIRPMDSSAFEGIRIRRYLHPPDYPNTPPCDATPPATTTTTLTSPTPPSAPPGNDRSGRRYRDCRDRCDTEDDRGLPDG